MPVAAASLHPWSSRFLLASPNKACVKWIKGDESGHKHCTGQYFDFWSCVDKCVAPKLFSKQKGLGGC